MSDPRLDRPLWRNRTNVDAFTIAWIEHAEAIVKRRWPTIAHPFVITQGGYQGDGGDPDSVGTHALGGGTDFLWCGHKGCLWALRAAGGFIWHRTPEQGPWPDHMHGAPIGHPNMAPALQRQEAAYIRRLNGLKGDGPDDGPRFDPIPSPVWPWPEEDDMFSDEDRKLLKGQGEKLDTLLKKADNSAERERNTNKILRKVRAEIKDAATIAEIDALLAEEK